MDKKELKVERTLTLSLYVGYAHITDEEEIKKLQKDEGFDRDRYRPSFAESLSPLDNMIEQLKDAPLGSKVRVTMEVI